jgi:hypothetical protein
MALFSEHSRMRFGRLLAAASLVLAMVAVSHAQTYLEVSPCGLVEHPEMYNGRNVRVRGRASIGFENFTLSTESCDGQFRGIWLIFGGDEPTPTMSTVNDQERGAGAILTVRRKRVPLKRDSSLELFTRRLIAQRARAPGSGSDGLGCYDLECYLYHVTATLTGVFFAAGSRPMAGYGHLGCCHLLAIEEVTDVVARRTPVPAGGKYACSTDAWELEAAEARQFQRRPCQLLRDCQIATGEQLARVSRHWDDQINVAEGSAHDATGEAIWESPDHLKSYSFHFRFEVDKNGQEAITGALASRRTCKWTSPPYPASTPIGCKRLWSDLHVSKTDAKNIQEEVNLGQESWRTVDEKDASRHALEDSASRWGIQLLPTLEFHGCDKPWTLKGDQFRWCEWTDITSMQAFSIQIARFGSLRHFRQDWSKVPWILTRGSGFVCTAENE